MALKYLFSQVPLHCNRPSPLLQFMFQALPRWNKRNALEHLSGVRLCAQLSKPSVPDLKEDQKTDSGKSAAEKIKNFDEETKKKLKILQLEYEVMKQLGSFRIPDNMTDELWLEMLTFPTVSARKRYYRYLRKIEVAKLGRELKKQKNREERLKEQDKPSQTKNTIFLFIRKSTKNAFYYSRLAHAMMFGQPIIFDMSFEDYMRKQDVHRLCEQFLMSYGANKIHPNPFHFVLSSNQSNSLFQNCLDNTRINKHTEDEHFLMTNSDQHYLDLYPKEKLVYLTPDAPSVLQTFDHDAIYIIGGLVDKIVSKPLTMAKAKREKLKMAKLPLDNYIRWGCGNKSLTLNQVIEILLEIKNGGSWPEAFQHIPQRKVRYVLKG